MVFAVGHVALYDGLTPYAAGDHFTGGELEVMGRDPDRLGRTIRLLGLWVDRDFGLVAWAPIWFGGAPALAGLLRRRPAGWDLLVAPLAAGWATATWVALTMHGWWWPGRQVVVVLPLVTLAIAWWVGDRASWRVLAGAAGAVGALTWGWLVAEVRAGERTLIVDFASTASPWFRLVHPLLPDGRAVTSTRELFVVWGVLLGAAAVGGWVGAPVSGARVAGAGAAGPSAAGDEDAGARERADADVAVVDLHGDRAVG